MQKKCALLWFCACMALFLPCPALGHYLWVIQEGSDFVVARGTPPDLLEPYHPASVSLVRAIDRFGSEIPIIKSDVKDRLVFRTARPPAIAAVVCDWGGRVNTTRGKKLMTRGEAEQQGFAVLEAFFSTHTSKTLFEEAEHLNRPLGLTLELVPLTSPFNPAQKEPLAVMVLFNGKPLNDAMVSSDTHVQTRTDDKGVALIDVSRKGWHAIMARHIVPYPKDTDADYHQYMTFLLFKVKR